MTAPTTAGPVAPRVEPRARPAIQVPAAVPKLNAETVRPDARVRASPARRTTRDISTGLAPSPKSPSRTTSAIVGAANPESRQIAGNSTVVAAGATIVVA